MMSSIVWTPAGGSVPSSTHVTARGRSAGSASEQVEGTAVVKCDCFTFSRSHVRELRLANPVSTVRAPSLPHATAIAMIDAVVRQKQAHD